MQIDPLQAAEKLVSEPAVGITFGLTVDEEHEKLYWADRDCKKICRANFDGSQVEDVVIGLVGPHDEKLDLDGGMIYWGDTGSVKRAKLPPVRDKAKLTAPPFIERISPPSASVGDVISIEGKNLRDVAAVRLIDGSSGKSAAAHFESHGAEGLSVAVPAMSDSCKFAAIIVQTKGGVTVTVPSDLPLLAEQMRIVMAESGVRVPSPTVPGFGSDDSFPGRVRVPKSDPRLCFMAAGGGWIYEFGHKVGIAAKGGFICAGARGGNTFFVKNGGIALPGGQKPSTIYYEPWAIVHEKFIWQPQVRLDHQFIPVPAIRLSVLNGLLRIVEQ